MAHAPERRLRSAIAPILLNSGAVRDAPADTAGHPLDGALIACVTFGKTRKTNAGRKQ